MSIETIWRAYKLPLLLSAVSLLCIALSLVLFVKSQQVAEVPIVFSSDSNTASASATVTVDIAGAVMNPGVYTLSLGVRVEDVIIAAGGFRADADSGQIAKSLNRAAKVSDGAKLYIPQIGESTQNNAIESDLKSINAASSDELESLPGVGPAIAKKIRDNRPYQTLEDLVTKKVMGQALFDKLKDQLSL